MLNISDLLIGKAKLLLHVVAPHVGVKKEWWGYYTFAEGLDVYEEGEDFVDFRRPGCPHARALFTKVKTEPEENSNSGIVRAHIHIGCFIDNEWVRGYEWDDLEVFVSVAEGRASHDYPLARKFSVTPANDQFVRGIQEPVSLVEE